MIYAGKNEGNTNDNRRRRTMTIRKIGMEARGEFYERTITRLFAPRRLTDSLATNETHSVIDFVH